MARKRNADGYRETPGTGPKIRSDVIDVYLFRQVPSPRKSGARSGIELLQLLRARPPLQNTWHPVMGHIEAGEKATAAAIRELREEVGLDASDLAVVGIWALEQVHPFYIAAIDSIVMSPRFAVEVAANWQPTLNAEHVQHRWVPEDDAPEKFMWPGQLAAIREIRDHIVPGKLAGAALRLTP